MKLFYFFLIITFLFQTIYANTEKIILKAKDNDGLACSLQSIRSENVLVPPYSEIQNSLIPNTTTYYYQLDKLREGVNYEVRISYPAITPADFRLKIVSQCKVNELLTYTLQVSAKYTGVSNIKGIESQPVTYNLVLEKLYFGFLFYQVYKIVIAISIVLCIGYFVFIPYLKNLIIKTVNKNE
ncbi:uncharacterized protein BX663DRAFT_561745 [Cokeromyces recurvatus]|uniref:uncharacterized protein n=1 Tax=Cokeromyces recurvatus TaxID=90255 RepID=UPI00221FE939|nr:uncharacterized protein BX663DRAFT_561745 [Cokeromyces recurvatus]KAI7902169.1 hypothetical protein BX663DRAFT_561745 [Cokeromyces recurvatus]